MSSAMETSLRRALEAGDAADPAFRESIYAASERALERMLAQKEVGEAAAHQQRARLAETINRVEDDFYERQTEAGAAEDGPAQHDPQLSLDPAYMDAHAYATHPQDTGTRHALEDAGEFDLTPVFGAGSNGETGGAEPVAMTASSGGESASEPVHPSPRARGAAAGKGATLRSNSQFRRFILLVLFVVFVVAAGAFVVFALTGSPGRDAATATGSEWIELFDGRRLQALATPNGGRVETLAGDPAGGLPAVRFTPAGAGSLITVAVGAGALSALAGRRALVEIAAGSPDGANRGFAVECRLGEAAACDRQVFGTPRRDETFVFDMNVPASPAAGVFAITPADAASLDIYSLRMRDGGAPAA